MKIGRNQKCPCGSDKKYKKCHLLTGGFPLGIPTIAKIESTPEIEYIRQQLEEKQILRRKRLEQLGVFIDFVIPTHFKNKKVWALGSRIYPYQRENETFHEFIIHALKLELGREWWETQVKLSEKERHFIFECFVKHYEWKDKNATESNKHGTLWGAKPDGYSRALLSLAFDVCSLLHAVHLPEIFLKKLRQYDGYQSVRYEIAIAALFARMGYKIKFFDEEFEGQKNPPKHSEFIATNPSTKEEVNIEVKSKEREGVLHKEGEFNKEREFRSSVSKLYRHALKQRQLDKPFIIFIDMNLPISSGVHPKDVEWMKTITKMRDAAAFSTKGKPSLTNAIIFTNYSYHYGTDKETGSGEWFLEKSDNPVAPIKSADFGDKFITVLNSYGKVPNIDVMIET
ncbi:MAG: SEC-C domain-containing protein [Patescibacteria group bacterium]|jgi:hypothetical protein